MKLSKQDQEFRNPKLFYPDPKSVDLDRVLVNLFLLLRCNGTRPVSRGRPKAGVEKIEYHVDQLSKLAEYRGSPSTPKSRRVGSRAISLISSIAAHRGRLCHPCGLCTSTLIRFALRSTVATTTWQMQYTRCWSSESARLLQTFVSTLTKEGTYGPAGSMAVRHLISRR